MADVHRTGEKGEQNTQVLPELCKILALPDLDQRSKIPNCEEMDTDPRS